MSWNKNRNRYREGFPDCLDAFRKLPDPRQSPATRHYFGEILFIALAATVSGMDGFEDITVFSREREDWLRSHPELPNGLPSADTYARVFAAIDPQAFVECFAGLVSSRCPALAGELIAIDGKTLRRSGTKGGRKALHVISAWAGSRGITLGQLAVGEKSNEITAVPKLLARLDVKGCVVSLDAMGCQHRTAVANRPCRGGLAAGAQGQPGHAARWCGVPLCGRRGAGLDRSRVRGGDPPCRDRCRPWPCRGTQDLRDGPSRLDRPEREDQVDGDP
jgi:hypothetical protein